MAGIVIPPGYANIVLRWQQSGRPNEYLSTIGIKLGTAVTPEDVGVAAAADWQAQWGPATLPTDYTFVGVTVYVGQDGGPPVSGEVIVNQLGTSSAARPSPNCALLVKKRTALGGRRNRGRMYLPAGYLTEADIGSDGRLTGASITTAQGKMTAFLGLLATGPETDGGVLFHSGTPSNPTDISALTVDAIIATQRERMRR